MVFSRSYSKVEVAAPQRACPRTTLDFASLDDHARLPARFFGRLFAARVAHLNGL